MKLAEACMSVAEGKAPCPERFGTDVSMWCGRCRNAAERSLEQRLLDVSREPLEDEIELPTTLDGGTQG